MALLRTSGPYSRTIWRHLYGLIKDLRTTLPYNLASTVFSTIGIIYLHVYVTLFILYSAILSCCISRRFLYYDLLLAYQWIVATSLFCWNGWIVCFSNRLYYPLVSFLIYQLIALSLFYSSNLWARDVRMCVMRFVAVLRTQIVL